MRRIWETICGYVWWTHKRGGFHYDVMVTFILLFIFLAPYWIHFKDNPTQHNPRQTEVVVVPDGPNFIYEIDAAVVRAAGGPATQDCGATPNITCEDLTRVVEPIAGEIKLLKYEQVRDSKGRIKSYKAWVRK